MRKRIVSMLLSGCLLAALTACTGEIIQDGSAEKELEKQTTNISIGNLEDNDLPKQDLEQNLKTEEMNLETIDLMNGIELMSTEASENLPDHPITKFGVPLLKNTLEKAKEGENVLISPMSAWTVLCMVEAGANGETKKQMQEVLAITEGDYLTYAKNFAFQLPEKDEYKVHMANGIWYKNVRSLHVEDYFLQYNKTFFDAAAYKAPFDDSTLQNINNWVSKNTDGMIPGILEEIKREDVIYLINALSFDAKWNKIYNETDIWKDTFTTETGEETLVTMLHSDENIYLEDENTTGFMKYYSDQKYAFVALLPKEGMTVTEYVESLTAEALQNLFDNKSQTKVKTSMPKFTAEYGFNMNEILIQMGMTDAFSDSNADFTKMATSDFGNIYIGSVDQKCFIAVDEYGTKAGAATAVAMANKMMLEKKKEVYLNRPFVYMIVECETYEPLFMGTIMNVEEK